jgi:hypothetical protein
LGIRIFFLEKNHNPFEIIATLDMYKINWQQTGKESKQSVLTNFLSGMISV